MASIVSISGLLLSVILLLISPACSLTCTSQKFTGNRIFANCTDLPTLESYLHWTYDASNSSLSIAFIAAPSKPEGWISWGINPSADGMLGSQAFIALKQPDGSVALKTFNISTYNLAAASSKLSFHVWNTAAELSSGGTMTIFATVKVPEKAEKLNQVWQVGDNVTAVTGVPAKHAMESANLNAKGTLQLVSAPSGGGDAQAPAPGGGGGGGGGAAAPAPHGGGSCRNSRINLGLISFPFLVLGRVVIF